MCWPCLGQVSKLCCLVPDVVAAGDKTTTIFPAFKTLTFKSWSNFVAE